MHSNWRIKNNGLYSGRCIKNISKVWFLDWYIEWHYKLSGPFGNFCEHTMKFSFITGENVSREMVITNNGAFPIYCKLPDKNWVIISGVVLVKYRNNKKKKKIQYLVICFILDYFKRNKCRVKFLLSTTLLIHT